MSEELGAAIKRLYDAVNFLDSCKQQSAMANATGAFRDAREWLESAAREVLLAAAQESL